MKRKLEVEKQEGTSKKVFPIFLKKDEASTSFRWITPALGRKGTCLHGVNLTPTSRAKVATFDLDGTLIKANFGKKKDPMKWEWWVGTVPRQLKEAEESGYSIVLITNQAIGSSRLVDWKRKISFIAAALPDLPFRILCASAKDKYRKPMVGMWTEVQNIFANDHVSIDKSASFYVGDAAGRDGDFAGTDRKWASNVGIKFLTPEEYFLKEHPSPFKFKGFHVSSLPIDLPEVTPTSTPIVPLHCRPEVVIFVGYPCLGKSTLFWRYFEPADYVHINQDMLGTRAKCVKFAQAALESGKSCVIDNTNRDRGTRQHYIKLGQDKGFPVRCFVFTGSLDLAWHNNLYRAYVIPGNSNEPPRDVLPYPAFMSFRDNYECPSLDEGISEIRKVNWKFEGDDDARRLWSMWLQIDGE